MLPAASGNTALPNPEGNVPLKDLLKQNEPESHRQTSRA